MAVDVLDACALLAFLWDEDGADQIESLLNDPARICHVHSITLCEIYYQIIRRYGESAAQQAIIKLRQAGIIERNDMDVPFWQNVAQHKSRGKISIADCFCLELAIRLSGEVVTSDHGEFDPIVPLGLCPIRFFR